MMEFAVIFSVIGVVGAFILTGYLATKIEEMSKYIKLYRELAEAQGRVIGGILTTLADSDEEMAMMIDELRDDFPKILGEKVP